VPGTVAGVIVRPTSAIARVACAVGLFALAACTNTESPVNRTPLSGTATASEVNGLQRITLLVGNDYRFHPSTFYVHGGRVDVTLKNTGSGAPHDFRVTKFPGDYVPFVQQPGQTMSSTFTTPSPGRYQFVCTVHVRQGMVGTMVVTR
jgi:plastocyanin